ncbi:MAG: hypothetical protein J6R29_01120 [Clostridia bacterium]|nr:hypothetical protein [Clostridia bacterium]
MEERKLSWRERKAKQAQDRYEQLEDDAKYAAKLEKKKIEKLIIEISKTEKEIIAQAAQAKARGYGDVYKTQLSALKLARARKTQAEKFLFQIDTMEKMKTLSQSSSDLLGSMNTIMSSLGKLSLDKNEMKKSQQNFASAQKNLGQQAQTIDQFFSKMEMHLPDDEDSIMEDVGYGNEALENEINAYMSGGVASASNVGASQGSAVDKELAELQQLLNG